MTVISESPVRSFGRIKKTAKKKMEKNLYKLVSSENTGIARPHISYHMEGNTLVLQSDDGPRVCITASPQTAMFNMEGKKYLTPFEAAAEVRSAEICIDGEGGLVEIVHSSDISMRTVMETARTVLVSKWVTRIKKALRLTDNDFAELDRVQRAAVLIKGGAVFLALKEHMSDVMAVVEPWRLEMYKKLFSLFKEQPPLWVWDYFEQNPDARKDALTYRWYRYIL